MNKSELCEVITKLEFETTQYWAIMGTSMVLHGIKDVTEDIDLGCTRQLIDILEKEGYKSYYYNNSKRYIKYSNNVELFEEWGEGEIVYVNNIPCISVYGLKKMKSQLGRKKDINDLKLIDEFIKSF